jgi:hypothetical protein
VRGRLHKRLSSRVTFHRFPQSIAATVPRRVLRFAALHVFVGNSIENLRCSTVDGNHDNEPNQERNSRASPAAKSLRYTLVPLTWGAGLGTQAGVMAVQTLAGRNAKDITIRITAVRNAATRTETAAIIACPLGRPSPRSESKRVQRRCENATHPTTLTLSESSESRACFVSDEPMDLANMPKRASGRSTAVLRLPMRWPHFGACLKCKVRTSAISISSGLAVFDVRHDSASEWPATQSRKRFQTIPFRYERLQILANE